MSYASEPVTPAKARPGTVTTSTYLLFLVAAVQLISAILAFAFAGDIQGVYEDAFSEVDGGDTAAGIAAGFVIGASVFGILVAAGLVILGIFNNRGKNAARITTWVLGGIFLCCGVGGLISQSAGGMSFGSQDPDVPTNSEIQDMLADVLPGWYNPVAITLTVLGVLALLTALILLALPPSNEFFRKPQPEWQPPAGGAGYQAYPAYPPVPGATSATPDTPQVVDPSAPPPPAAPGASAPADDGTPPGSDPSAPPPDRPAGGPA